MFHVRETGIALYALIVPEIFRVGKTVAAAYAHVFALVFRVCKAGTAFYAKVLALVLGKFCARTAFTRALRMRGGCVAAWRLHVRDLYGCGGYGPGAQGNGTKYQKRSG